MTILDFSHCFSLVAEKIGPCMSRSYFGSWGHALVAVAVVERWPLEKRFKQEPLLYS